MIIFVSISICVCACICFCLGFYFCLYFCLCFCLSISLFICVCLYLFISIFIYDFICFFLSLFIFVCLYYLIFLKYIHILLGTFTRLDTHIIDLIGILTQIYILYFSIFIKMIVNLIRNLYRAAVSHLRLYRYDFWYVGATNTVNNIYSIFIRYILSYSEAICRLPQTLIMNEPNNSVHKPESTNRIPLALTTHEPNNSDCEPKTQNHCLGPKIHRLSLELALI